MQDQEIAQTMAAPTVMHIANYQLAGYASIPREGANVLDAFRLNLTATGEDHVQIVKRWKHAIRDKAGNVFDDGEDVKECGLTVFVTFMYSLIWYALVGDGKPVWLCGVV